MEEPKRRGRKKGSKNKMTKNQKLQGMYGTPALLLGAGKRDLHTGLAYVHEARGNVPAMSSSSFKQLRKQTPFENLASLGYSQKGAEKIEIARYRGHILAARYRNSGYKSYKEWLKDNSGKESLKVSRIKIIEGLNMPHGEPRNTHFNNLV